MSDNPDKIKNPTLSRPSYVGRHPGSTFLVLGTGPSLETYRDEIYGLIKKYDPIVMGPNHLTHFIHPHYHAFTSSSRFRAYGGTIDPGKSKALLNVHFSSEFIRRTYPGPFEYLMYVDDHSARFDISDGIIQASCRTASVLLIGVAIAMGARQILVAGLDGVTPPQLQGEDLRLVGIGAHYTATEKVPGTADYHYQLKVGRLCQRFLDEIGDYMTRRGLEPFKIVTPTAYANHYEDVRDYL